MHAISEWFTRNPVAANLLMMLIILGGILTAVNIRTEAFPRIPPNSITITVVYPGASPEQVDEGITRKIEEALRGMPGVRKTMSVSSDEISIVWVQKTTGYDLQVLLNDAKNRVDGIYSFPQLAERPVFTRDEFSIEACIVQVYSDTDEQTLQQTGRMVEKALLAHPAISKIQVFGKKSYEVSIEIDQSALMSFGLSLEDIQSIINANSLDYRAGKLSTTGGDIMLRVDEKAFVYEDFVNIPVARLSDGRKLLLKDVATVKDEFEEITDLARFNNEKTVGMLITTGDKGNLFDVSKAAREVIGKIKPQLPDSIRLDIWADSSLYIRSRLDLLKDNALQGLVLVFIMLAVFLNFRLAFWVAAGLPVAIGGTLALLGPRFLNYSINDITTFGLIIVLGFLVDDAIVVGESVFEERRHIHDPVEGTIKGVARVATATVFGAFTTIAAFFPLVLIENEIARIFAGFSVVVIIAILFSLLESKCILPAHLSGVSLEKNDNPSILSRPYFFIQHHAAQLLEFINTRIYRPVLEWSLKQRYACLIILTSVAILGTGVVFTGKMKLVFFPDVPGNTIFVNVKMKNSSPISLTLQNLKKIELAAERTNQSLANKFDMDTPPISKLLAAVVDQYNIEVYGEIEPEAMNEIGTIAIMNQWRDETGALEGTDETTFSGSFETGGGFAIDLVARDLTTLKTAVDSVSATLAGIAGVSDVRDDLKAGEPEIRLRLKPEARHLGFTMYDFASQIGSGYGGLEVQRMQRQSDEVKVYVRYGKDKRQSLHDLMTSYVRTPAGDWLPLLSVAKLESGYGIGSINRRNSERTVRIQASVDKSVTGAQKILERLDKKTIPELLNRYPGLEIRLAGELEEGQEVKSGLVRALIFIMILIYALLAVPLKSYWQPFIIMTVVPFGFTGAVLGHYLLDLPLSVLSFFGMLAASGVVINDSLVMTTRFNQLREEGLPFKDALVASGSSRFRAIFLTTATTVIGLTPLMAETSEQAQYLIPAAASLAFAELFATPITLLLIPLLLHVSNDVRNAFAWLKSA